ncbi:hypothetical protein ABIC03_002017 [Bradyrhizobium sp. RT6a]|uniref:hypothetical protein n=1 Tax=Bradyrhizobium sp. RT6a TaxID=3156381 RepID=UPI0033997683
MDLWVDAKCFKLLGGQFENRGNMPYSGCGAWQSNPLLKNGTETIPRTAVRRRRNKQPTLLSFDAAPSFLAELPNHFAEVCGIIFDDAPSGPRRSRGVALSGLSGGLSIMASHHPSGGRQL